MPRSALVIGLGVSGDAIARWLPDADLVQVDVCPYDNTADENFIVERVDGIVVGAGAGLVAQPAISMIVNRDRSRFMPGSLTRVRAFVFPAAPPASLRI